MAGDKMAQRLSDAHARNAKAKLKPYKLADGRGLYLLVQPNGSRLWRYKYRLKNVENVFAIGRYPEVGLQQAREARQKANQLVLRGLHPARERSAERLNNMNASADTFSCIAREWMDKKSHKWNKHNQKKVRSVMAKEVMSKIGHLPIKAVTSNQLLSIMEAVEGRGAASIALLIRQWCSAVFQYAIGKLRADKDPTAALKGVIEKPNVVHKRPLSKKEIGTFLSRLETASGHKTIKIGLEILLLTFVRPGELRGARWEELDLQAGDWRIPESRMKMDSPHIVPLSRQAVALFERLKSERSELPQVFPNARDQNEVMSPSTFNRFIERMGYKGQLSAHAFRATASTELNEMGFNRDVIELQLAHQERDKVRASYNQADRLTDRRKMMQEWADFVDAQRSVPDNVIPIRAGVSV